MFAGDSDSKPRANQPLRGAVLRSARVRQARLRLIDLFAGAGGISEGFRQAGYEVVAGNDNDPDACATFALNFPEGEVIHGDIRERETRSRVIAAAKSCDVVVGGPPCQAFSQVRNHTRLIDDPRNSLYREFVRVVAEINPKAFVMENVTGIDQMGVRNQIIRDLSLNGQYTVLAQVLDAANFGVPQTRKRLLFIGVNRSLGVDPPEVAGTEAIELIALGRFATRGEQRYQVVVDHSLTGAHLASSLVDPGDLSAVSAEQAISDLEGLAVGNRYDVMDVSSLPPPKSAYQRLMRKAGGSVLSNVQVPRINADTVLRLKAIPPGGNHRDLSPELLERYLTGHRWGQENGSGLLSRRHFYAYRRLHPDIWAWTLNTKGDSVYHYKVSRSLSVREFARLQSFPDRFQITTDPRRGPLPGRHDGGPAHSRYRQAGNAVPPLLAKAVGEALSVTLATAHEALQAREPLRAKAA